MPGPRRRWFHYTIAVSAALGGMLGLQRWAAQRAEVTFARDIAPLGFEHCAPCHRPGQAGPFSLLDYEDFRRHGRDMAEVVARRYMPPWKPTDRSDRYLGQRSLSDAQIALIQRWVEAGMPEGDPSELPPPPQWSSGWSLGQPDAVVRLAEPYTLAADGDDEYRNFVIPSPSAAQRFVVGWELKPGSRAVHHAILQVDRQGNARRADAADPAPGFSAMELEGAQAPDGFYLVWAPGKSARRVNDGSAWRLDAATDLVLQMHLQRTGKRETIAPEIALYFSDQPPTQRRISLRIGDPPIDIPAGARDYRIHDSYSLPAAVRLLGLFPHAHYLARRVRVWSRQPDGAELELLRIDDWDFNWQDEYSFVEPPLLAAGSTLEMELSYDNSADNERNPSRPPIRVRSGNRSVDEMGNVTFQALANDPGQIDLLLESKYRRQLGPAPSAEALYNLANALSRQGKRDEARAQYLAAIARDPQLSAARYNLAGLFLADAKPEPAIEQLVQVLALRPDDQAARLALGHARELANQLDGAIEQYQRVLAREPQHEVAQRLLAAALRKRGGP